MKRRIVVFGIGVVGKWFINDITSDEVTCIIDNDKNLQGKQWNGIDIVSLSDYLRIKEDNDLVVITVIKYADLIIKQLESEGINSFELYYNFWIKRNLILESKNIYLMNTHSFNNVGDYAITYAERTFLKKNFGCYKVIEIPSVICKDGMELLTKYIKSDELIIISGGGYMGNLWIEYGEENVRNILSVFKNNKILIMPQTIYFTDDEDGEKEEKISKQYLDEHKHLKICLRDRDSVCRAESMLDDKKKIEYLPDIVLYLNLSDNHKIRNKYTLCLRSDKEQMISDEQVNSIKQMIQSRSEDIQYMTMNIEDTEYKGDYFEKVNEKLQLIKSSKLVITDRLHCMLLCAVTGTPCIAFDNLSHKVSGVYEWINKLEYIQLYDETLGIEKQFDYFAADNMFYTYDFQCVSTYFQKLADLIRKMI